MAQWSICNAGGSTVCPLFHMSLPNTFPFTLALSICHWGLPHGVNHVSWWWSRLFCNLLALSCLHLFFSFFTARYNKHRLAFFFFLFFFAVHKGWCMQPHLSVLAARVSPFASLFALLCAQDTLYSFIPSSPTSPPALIPGHLPQIPIGDGSALEFIPHHPAELWPSNSQPLWPRQMNNKTRALQLISGKKKKKKKNGDS